MANSIGTLSEKSLHAALKCYLEPDTAYHEIPVGKYIADIAKGNMITEIQTRALYRLASKLSTFLVENSVTLVYPIVQEKILVISDAQTGEITTRKSPKKQKEIEVLAELYGLREFLTHPRFRVKVILLTAEETRVKKKSRVEKCDLLPKEILSEFILEMPTDYLRFLPQDLSEDFTSEALAKKMKIKLSTAQTALNLLTRLGILEKTGKNGRFITYKQKLFI